MKPLFLGGTLGSWVGLFVNGTVSVRYFCSSGVEGAAGEPCFSRRFFLGHGGVHCEGYP